MDIKNTDWKRDGVGINEEGHLVLRHACSTYVGPVAAAFEALVREHETSYKLRRAEESLKRLEGRTLRLTSHNYNCKPTAGYTQLREVLAATAVAFTDTGPAMPSTQARIELDGEQGTGQGTALYWDVDAAGVETFVCQE